MTVMRVARVASFTLLLAAQMWGEPLLEGRHGRVQPGFGVPAPIGFRAVGWLDERPGMRVRASEDGIRWSDWQTAGHDADRLVYFGELEKFIELDTPGATDPVPLLFIDPGTTDAIPRAELQRGADASSEAPALVARAQWGCTPVTCPAKDPPVYTVVTHLIVHHTAGANNATDWPAVVRSIWVLHVMGNGWNDIGYNYLIDPNGVLYEGRAGGDGVMGAHFSGVNSGTMGVSMMGTYSTLPLRRDAEETLRTMLVWQAGKWNVDASGKKLHAASGLVLDGISGHRDANNSKSASGTTECPGNGVYTVLPALRREVNEALAGSCPITLSGRNQCVGNGGGDVVVRISAADGCRWQATSDSDWLRVKSVGADSVILAAGANTGTRRAGTVTVAGRAVAVTQSAASEGALACVSYNGVGSIVGGDQPVAGGSWVSIYGSGLAEHDEAADPAALPKSLGGTSVAVNGRAGAIGYASAGQINIQIPPETGIGEARLVVTANGVAGPEAMFAVTEAAPAIYATADLRAIAQNYDDGKRNGPDTPARPGGVVTFYVTGAGAVRGFPATGSVTPGAPFPATLPWSATIGGRAAGALYLGLAPGMVGIYQMNLAVPMELSAGDQAVVITVAGASSAAALLTVGAN